MRITKGPRPWPVLLFTAVTTTVATLRLWEGLNHLNGTVARLNGMLPMVDWNLDLAIVYTSAWFTIDMIPAILVVVFAARFARIFISVMSLASLALILSNIEYASTYPNFLVPGVVLALLPVALAMLLWTKPASRYFAQEGDDHAEAT